MRESEKQPGKYSGVAKVGAGSAAILLVSIGLCGLSLQAPNHYSGGLAMISLLGMGAGVLGLLGSMLAAAFMFFSKD